MRLRILPTLLLLLFALDVRAETPWGEIAHSIAEYSANPSSVTASAAIKVIPKTPVRFTNSREEDKALNSIYATGPMRVLEKHVLMKERESVELAFRMRNISDGAFGEDLDIILGKLIRPMPSMFLTELKRADVPPDGIVGNLGEDFDDRIDRQCMELRLRKKAVEGVADPSLKQVREQALSALARDSEYCQKGQKR